MCAYCAFVNIKKQQNLFCPVFFLGGDNKSLYKTQRFTCFAECTSDMFRHVKYQRFNILGQNQQLLICSKMYNINLNLT